MSKKKKLKELVSRLKAENDDLRHELDGATDQVLKNGERLCELRNQHLMQLAAISTASVQNTPESIKHRIPPYDYCGVNSGGSLAEQPNPYYTQAYADVCAAIDREMALIDQLRQSKDCNKEPNHEHDHT